MEHDFDVVVVGAGHAGCEAAHVVARMGLTAGLVTMSTTDIGALSCNPAVGGIGKGHLVREIDAMGGLMARVADEAGIHFRLLNASKGPAVRGPRAQVCSARYARAMRREMQSLRNIGLIEAEVVDIVRDGTHARGVELVDGSVLRCKAVILTTGTFLGGAIHIGQRSMSAGRMGSAAAMRLKETLASNGLRLGSFKTGTPPRLDGTTIDWSAIEWQPGDAAPSYLSHDGPSREAPQVSCGITHTNPRTHKIVADNLSEAAFYGDRIASRGPRYCPSIEDKVSRFPDRRQHQVFLEPVSVETDTVYPNGISTSLGEATQAAMVRSVRGLEECRILRPGYAIEYSHIDPRTLTKGLRMKVWSGLFLAGQINGTTGYEEAAGQGLVAGINAARLIQGHSPWHPDRTTSYLGVLCDDLTRFGVSEPYRMFTSRSENRLVLRPDNAWERLRKTAYELGSVGAGYETTGSPRAQIREELDRRLKEHGVTAKIAKEAGLGGSRGEYRNLRSLLSVPGAGLPLFEKELRLTCRREMAVLSAMRADALYSMYLGRAGGDGGAAGSA